jgi:Ca2+-binding EF-hand superfamily protein
MPRATAALILLGASVAGTPLVAQETQLTEQHLAAVDIDKDDSVSKSEYRIFMSNVFILLDEDNDGLLAKGDASAVLSDDQFAATDADGDGSVSWAELDAQTRSDFDAADKDGNGSLD